MLISNNVLWLWFKWLNIFNSNIIASSSKSFSSMYAELCILYGSCWAHLISNINGIINYHSTSIFILRRFHDENMELNRHYRIWNRISNSFFSTIQTFSFLNIGRLGTPTAKYDNEIDFVKNWFSVKCSAFLWYLGSLLYQQKNYWGRRLISRTREKTQIIENQCIYHSIQNFF